MKTKITTFFIVLMSVGLSISAQQIQEENITYNKKSVPAVSILIPDLDIVTIQAALDSYMSNQGLKRTKMGSFNAYFNQICPKIGEANYDMYTTVLSKGKRKDQKTYAYFLLAKGNENFVNSSSSPAEIANVKVFLSEFLAYTKEFAVEQNISQTKEAIKKLEKEHKSLNKKQEKYQKSINKTNKKKEKTDKEAGKVAAELQKMQALLKQLESQLKK